MASVQFKLGEHEIDIDLDSEVADQIADQTGEEDVDNVDLKATIDVTGNDDLDDAVVKLLKTVGDVAALQAGIDEARDDDAGQAAFLVAHDRFNHPDADDVKSMVENLSWAGGLREDETDYAQYVIDEGLMGDKIDNYLDHERIGRDYLMDSRTTEMKDGRIIVWNE